MLPRIGIALICLFLLAPARAAESDQSAENPAETIAIDPQVNKMFEEDIYDLSKELAEDLSTEELLSSLENNYVIVDGKKVDLNSGKITELE